MTRPRSTRVSVADMPYYHCIGRCARRAFLRGEDIVTGRSFTHPRQWMLDRLKVLTESFAIDLCAYALMSNHYHLVLKIDEARVKGWSDKEIVERWTRLYSGPLYAHKFLQGEPLSEPEQEQLGRQIPIWTSRLTDLSMVHAVLE